MRATSLSLAVFALLASFTIQTSQAQEAVPIGACGASRSTWFADNQHGACMYGPSLGPTGNGNFLICASSMLVFDNSADCGACYQITGPNGTSVIVTVVDQCTDGGVCNTTFPHLDLSPQAFDTLANPNVAGVINTNVQRVACPVQGGVKLHVGTDFFSPISWEILIFNHRLPITQVTMSYPGLSAPVSLPRQTYNYWRYDGPAVSFPVTITVTDNRGDQVTFQPLTFTSGLIVEATGQFPLPTAYPGSSEAGCPAPPPVAVTMGGWIYEDSLTKEFTDTTVSYINTFQWSDWSYGATINWESTNDPYSGTDCVQAVLGNPGGIQIGQATSFPWTSYFTSLQFAIRGSEAFGSLSVGWKGSIQVPVEVTTSWQLITLDLSSTLQTPALIGGQVLLTFQNNLHATSPTIFLDSIRLVPVSSSAGSTVPPTPTPTPASTSTSTSTSSSTAVSTTSTSTSSTAVSTTSTSSHPTTPTTPTTPPSSTSSTGAASSCPLTATQTLTNSWQDGSGATVSQYSVTITNSGSSAFQMKLTLSGPVVAFWNLITESDGSYGLPAYQSGGISADSTFEWGYQVTSSSPLAVTFVVPSCGAASSPSSSSVSASSSTSASSASTAVATSASSSTSSSSSSSSSSASSSSSSSSSTGSGGTSASSTGTVSPPSSPCTAVLTQTITGTWSDSNNQYTQWGVTLLNTSPLALMEVAIQPNISQASRITQFWSMDADNGQYVFPSWIDTSGGVSPETAHPWGYISIGTTPVTFTVLAATCGS